MTRKQRLRRVGILCCHCIRNLAFYRAGWRDQELVRDGQFWTNVNSNFLDLCVLEWCKLFADRRGKQCWEKVITNQQEFSEGLLDLLDISQEDLDTYIAEMRKFRDKFVAHLDSEDVMEIPSLTLAKRSVSHLYDYLLANEDDDHYFADAPASSTAFYRRCSTEARLAYEN